MADADHCFIKAFQVQLSPSSGSQLSAYNNSTVSQLATVITVTPVRIGCHYGWAGLLLRMAHIVHGPYVLILNVCYFFPFSLAFACSSLSFASSLTGHTAFQGSALKMLLRISYTTNGQPITKQHQVASFPGL